MEENTARISQKDLSIFRFSEAYDPEGHYELSTHTHATDRLRPGKFRDYCPLQLSLAKDMVYPFLRWQPTVILSHVRDPASFFAGRIAQCLTRLTFEQKDCPTLHPAVVGYGNKPLPGEYAEDELVESFAGQRVLLYQSVFSTGEKLAKLIRSITDRGGECIGMAALCSRNPIRLEEAGLDIPTFSRFHLPAKVYDVSVCPACQAKHPLMRGKK